MKILIKKKYDFIRLISKGGENYKKVTYDFHSRDYGK